MVQLESEVSMIQPTWSDENSKKPAYNYLTHYWLHYIGSSRLSDPAKIMLMPSSCIDQC